MKSICVFCGSSDGNDSQITEAAVSLGKALVKRNDKLVYGGAKIGIMGTVADTVLKEGGYVIGVIPAFLKKKEVVHTGLNELIVTKNMNDRKLKMLALSNGFVTLPGGFGTLEELFEVATGLQLGQHKKPIGLLNVNGFYDPFIESLQKMVTLGFLRQQSLDLLLINNTVAGLLAKMDAFVAPEKSIC